MRPRWSWVGIMGGAAILIVFALQYPWRSSFPIGGDAAFYANLNQTLWLAPDGITRVRLLTSTAYPFSVLLFSLSYILPLSEPAQMIMWMALGQIVVGGILALVVYRIGGWKGAACALAIWGLTPVDINNHFESGTLAQLWSLVALGGAWYGITALSLPLTLGACFLALGMHPLSGLVLLLTLITALPALLRRYPQAQKHEKGFIKGVTLFLAGTVILLVLFVLWRSFPLPTSIRASTEVFLNILHSSFGVFVVIAPLGVLAWLRQPHPTQRILFSSFVVVVLLLAGNAEAGIGIWANRFQTYGIVLVTLLSATALPLILAHTFTHRALKAMFVTMLFASLAVLQWPGNDRIYAYYESPIRYGRLHPTEREAIEWLAYNTPASSLLYVGSGNRHYEWVSVLSDRQVEAYTHRALTGAARPIYFVFFTKTDDIPEEVRLLYPVFKNEGAVIYAHQP